MRVRRDEGGDGTSIPMHILYVPSSSIALPEGALVWLNCHKKNVMVSSKTRIDEETLALQTKMNIPIHCKIVFVEATFLNPQWSVPILYRHTSRQFTRRTTG
jgi:hypothetical protein